MASDQIFNNDYDVMWVYVMFYVFIYFWHASRNLGLPCLVLLGLEKIRFTSATFVPYISCNFYINANKQFKHKHIAFKYILPWFTYYWYNLDLAITFVLFSSKFKSIISVKYFQNFWKEIHLFLKLNLFLKWMLIEMMLYY